MHGSARVALSLGLVLHLALPGRSTGSAAGLQPAQPPPHAPAGMQLDAGHDRAKSPGGASAVRFPDRIRGLDDDWDSEWDGGLREHVQPRENWLDLPYPLELKKGETKHDFCSRLRPYFKHLTDDQFLYKFHELWWPEYKEEKRSRARHRGCGLRAHVARALALDEAEPVETRIPYSQAMRKMLDGQPNMTAFIASQAHKGHSKLVNASRSPQHALWSACQLGADDETIFRLSETADLNAPCRKMNNFTALHFAAERGQQNVVEVLIALRANTLAQTSALEGEEYGLTPRDLAAAHGHPQAIK